VTDPEFEPTEAAVEGWPSILLDAFTLRSR